MPLNHVLQPPARTDEVHVAMDKTRWGGPEVRPYTRDRRRGLLRSVAHEDQIEPVPVLGDTFHLHDHSGLAGPADPVVSVDLVITLPLRRVIRLDREVSDNASPEERRIK